MNNDINQRFEEMLKFLADIEQRLSNHSGLKFIYELGRDLPLTGFDRGQIMARLYDGMQDAQSSIAKVRMRVERLIQQIEGGNKPEF